MRRPILRQHEVAFVMEVAEADVRNMLRRGQRLQDRGMTDEAVVETGALPTCPTGTRLRGIRPLLVAQHERVAGHPLREAALRAICSGVLRAPRAQRTTDLPPAILDRLHNL